MLHSDLWLPRDQNSLKTQASGRRPSWTWRRETQSLTQTLSTRLPRNLPGKAASKVGRRAPRDYLHLDARKLQKRLLKSDGKPNLIRQGDVTNIHKSILQERQQSPDTRRKYFSNLERYFEGRAIVSFFTSFDHPVSIDDDDCDMLQTVLQTLDLSKGLALIISSPGGDGLAAERIVNTCRAYSGTHDYWAIVPGKAKSAATIISMGAAKIFMAPPSELGPVDPQILKVENGVRKAFSAYSLVQGYDRLFKEAVSSAGHLEPYIQQLANYDDREINAFRSVITLADSIAVKILESGMMAGMDATAIKNAIKIFLDPEAGTLSHGRPIFALEARACGLKIEDLDVHTSLWKELYDVYARTEFFVSHNACKAVESKKEAFHVAVSNG